MHMVKNPSDQEWKDKESIVILVKNSQRKFLINWDTN